VPDPDLAYGLPSLSLVVPTAAAAPAVAPPMAAPEPGAGVTWRQGGGGAAPRVYMRQTPQVSGPISGNAQVQTRTFTRQGPPPGMAMHGGAYGGGHGDMRGGGGTYGGGAYGGSYGGGGTYGGSYGGGTYGGGAHGGSGMYGHGGMTMHGGISGHRATHWQRINRGGFLPQMWWGPQFSIGNWGAYGFPAPVNGGRWVRYYDDALMVGPDGRVLDGRYGWDWDRDGDRWGYDDEGVPMYRGDGYGDNDGAPDEEWTEREERYDEGPGPMRRMPPPPPRPGPAYGYGGCGCGYGMPVLISETIVTEPPVIEQRTYVTTVVERVRAAPRRRAPTKLIRLAPPRPGERG
ncbi:MAG: RcnB family protein, partial [Allosphingosinicella sp.]